MISLNIDSEIVKQQEKLDHPFSGWDFNYHIKDHWNIWMTATHSSLWLPDFHSSFKFWGKK